MRGAGTLVMLAIVGLAAPASASDVSVSVPGCPEIEAAVSSALRLEIGSGWEVVERAHGALELEIRAHGCESTDWQMSVLAPDGRRVLGPDVIAMAAFSVPARARVAALWAADRLPAPLEPSPHREPEPPAPSLGVYAETPVSAAMAEPSPLAVLTVGVGAAGFVDEANLSPGAPWLRVGIEAAVHELVRLGLSLEAGISFEPFDHLQPFARLCAEPQLSIPLDDDLGLDVGPKLCLSGSRHLQNAVDNWTAGVAIGGLARLSLRLEEIELGLRFDGDAWERDAFVPLPPIGMLGPSGSDLPWVGVFGGSIELRAWL